MEKKNHANHRKSGITEIKKGLFCFLGNSHVGVKPKQKMTNCS